MKKIVDGVTLYRRPPSSCCPKGAWETANYHTCWSNGTWNVYRTGKMLLANVRLVRDAQAIIAEQEKQDRKGNKLQ
jgi:hypothetical protein